MTGHAQAGSAPGAGTSPVPGQGAASGQEPAGVTYRRLSTPVRVLLVVGGTVSLAVGIIGWFIPGLPTMKFIVFAAWAYARSSRRLYLALVGNRFVAPRLTAWRARPGVPVSVKVVALASAWLAVGTIIVVAVDSTLLRSLLLAVLLTKTVVLLSVPTAPRRADPGQPAAERPALSEVRRDGAAPSG